MLTQYLFQRDAINYSLQYDKGSIFKSRVLYPWQCRTHYITFNFSFSGYRTQCTTPSPVSGATVSWERKGWLKRRERAKKERQVFRRAQRVCSPVRFHFFCGASRDCEAPGSWEFSIELRRMFRLNHCPASSSYYLCIYLGILIPRAFTHRGFKAPIRRKRDFKILPFLKSQGPWVLSIFATLFVSSRSEVFHLNTWHLNILEF